MAAIAPLLTPLTAAMSLSSSSQNLVLRRQQCFWPPRINQYWSKPIMTILFPFARAWLQDRHMTQFWSMRSKNSAESFSKRPSTDKRERQMRRPFYPCLLFPYIVIMRMRCWSCCSHLANMRTDLVDLSEMEEKKGGNTSGFGWHNS